MGLFDKDKLDGIFNTTKEAMKNTTEKISKTFSETSENVKQHSEESKILKEPVEGAITRYGITYNGGLAKYPKLKNGEIGLNILQDSFFLKPTKTTIDWFEEMSIPYGGIKKLEIVERTVSNAEWLLSSSGSDMKAMQQKNNIEISYVDDKGKDQLIRLEMLTGVSIYGQAKKCVEFMDVLRQNDIFSKFMGEQEENKQNTSSDDILGQVEKLAVLKEKGILTEEEFNQKKALLLEKL